MFYLLIIILIFAAFLGDPEEKEKAFQRQMIQQCLEHNPTTDVCKGIIKKYMDKDNEN